MRRCQTLLLVSAAALTTGCYSKRWTRLHEAPAMPEETPVTLFVSPDLEHFEYRRWSAVGRMDSELSPDARLVGRVDIEAMFLWTRDSILEDAQVYARQLGGNALVLFSTDRWNLFSDPRYHFRVYTDASTGDTAHGGERADID